MVSHFQEFFRLFSLSLAIAINLLRRKRHADFVTQMGGISGYFYAFIETFSKFGKYAGLISIAKDILRYNMHTGRKHPA
jgi:hypothetical protein